jgi:hypothetical protein
VYTRLRRHLSYANLTATVALFVALGGTAAATTSFVVASNADIAPNTVSGAKPPAGLHGNIVAKSIAGADLAAAAVTSQKLAGDAVSSSKVADGSLTGADLAPGTISGTQLAADAITSDKVADGSLTGADLAPDSVTGAQIDESTLGRVPVAINADFFGGLAPTGWQQRVSDACPVGSAIGAVGSSGSVFCNAESVRPGSGSGSLAMTVAARSCVEVEAVVGGIAVGDTAIIAPDGARWPAGLIFQALRADQPGHVPLEVCNPTDAGVSSGTVTVSFWPLELNP